MNSAPVNSPATPTHGISPERLEEIYKNDPAILMCQQRIVEAKQAEELRVKELQGRLSKKWEEAKVKKEAIRKLQGEYNHFVGGIKALSKRQRRRYGAVRAQERRIEIRKRVIRNKLEREAIKKTKQSFRSQWSATLKVAGI